MMVDVVQFKRPAMPSRGGIVKRARFDEAGGVMVASGPATEQPGGVQRTSRLAAPIMLLTGHDGEIFTARFSPDGQYLATSGYDQKIFLWNVYGNCENFSTLGGHKGSVMDAHFSSDTSRLYSCSSDKTVRVWDMDTGVCVRKFRTHEDIVNSCHPSRRGPALVCSGSDDGTVLVHDVRKRENVARFEMLGDPHRWPVTAVTFNDNSTQLICGGIDHNLKIWDLRKNEVAFSLAGHTDIITGLALSPDGSYVLSNSMDCTARVWDVRPFAGGERCTKLLHGHQHNFEKNLIKCGWSPDGQRVTCGSSDRYVYVWDIASKRIVYKLPGHQGSVNAADFHPIEPILLSAGSDKRVFLGELTATG